MPSLLAALLTVMAGLVGGAWLAWRHEAVLPWLLGQVPGLQASEVTGSLARGGLRIARLDWQLPGQAGRLQLWQLQVDGARLALWHRPGAQALVQLRGVQAARLQFDSGPPSGTPFKLPASLGLPIDLAVDNLAIAELQVDALPPMRQLSARLSLGADGGRQHRVDDLSVQLMAAVGAAPPAVAAATPTTPARWVQVNGLLAIDTAAPMAVQAQLQARQAAAPAHAAPAWHASLQATGPLARLSAQATLSGQAAGGGPAPSLQARAVLMPLAAWPLGALDLQTEALDLAALSPDWPQTRLSGRAEVQTQGLDRPATARITLDNGLPGAWDSGRLPLRQLQLQASGALNQPDRLQVQQFQLQLADANGPAGRLSGQGQWQADTLSLDLQVAQLLPARLHGSAAAILLDGPVKLRLRGLPTAGGAAGSAPASASASASASATGSGPGPAPAAAQADPVVAVDARLSGRWLDGAGLPVQLRLVGEGSRQGLKIDQAEARAGSALAQLTGQARPQGAGWQVQGQASLAGFDPRPWWRGAEGSAWRRGPHRWQGEAQADLLLRRPAPARGDILAVDRWLAAVDGQASLTLHDSLLAGVPLSGRATLKSQGAKVQVDAHLDLAGQQLALQGQGGGAAEADQWHARLQGPDLAALAPVRSLVGELWPGSTAGWPTAGSLQADAKVQGRWPAVQSQGEARATGLVTPAARLQGAQIDWRYGHQADAPLQLQARAQGLHSGAQQIDQLSLDLRGTLASHRLVLKADSPARPPAWTENLLGPAGTGTRLEAEARGQWQAPGPQGPGQYRVSGMTLQGGARDAQGGSRAWLAAQGLSGEMVVSAEGVPLSLQLAPGRVQLLSTALNWRSLAWQAGTGGPTGTGERLDVVAELETINLAALLGRLQPGTGWRGDLTLGGRIELHSSPQRLDADIVLERGSGDLSVVDDLGQAQRLGLSDLRLALTVHDGQWQFAQGLVGSRIGTLAGAQRLQMPPGQRWPTASAPLVGVLEARVADLGVWGTWVPPGWRLAGALDTTAQFDGTLAAPRVTGSMTGSGLGLRNVLEGVNLSDGKLAVVFGGDVLRIDQASFQGGDGQLVITGGATLGAQPRLTLQFNARRFRALGRVDRRVVASGQAELVLDADRLRLDGGFTVDEGLFDIGRGDAPTLDADVTVLRDPPPATTTAAATTTTTAGSAEPVAGAAAPRAARNLQVALSVKLGLGERLRLRGQGVDTALRGDLLLTSPGGKLAINGTVTTQDGRYAAYGQRLEITRGRFVFSGEPDNPRLDVLAIRPNLDVTVGVLIDGNAHNPRVRLFSEPELAEYDKLSWLVLGRSPDGLGSADTALLQRAAFALLAGNSTGPTDQLLQAIGLTDFSLRQTEGDTRDTIISLGKQLSRRWYVGYERGVHATTGTWQLVYRIAQRFTLRAQSGSENAIDLIWSWRW